MFRGTFCVELSHDGNLQYKEYPLLEEPLERMHTDREVFPTFCLVNGTIIATANHIRFKIPFLFPKNRFTKRVIDIVNQLLDLLVNAGQQKSHGIAI